MKITKDTLADFESFCKDIGNRFEFIQGTGGNFSIKENNLMAIKASGVRVKDITKDSGYSLVNYMEIFYLYETNRDEKSVVAGIKKTVINNIKPSLEVAFHSYLPKYVMHTHPISIGLMLCTKEWKELLGALIDEEHIFIDYKKPGHPLAIEIKKKLDLSTDVKIIFLQNHGMIVCSNDKKECERLTIDIEHKAHKFLNSKGVKSFIYEELQANQFRPGIKRIESFLFPDAIVFFFDNKKIDMTNGIKYLMNFENAKKIDETIMTHIYLEKNIRKIGTPRYLNENEVNEIVNMESEKYRKKLIGI